MASYSGSAGVSSGAATSSSSGATAASAYRFREFPSIAPKKGFISRWVHNPQNLPMVGKIVQCVVSYNDEERTFMGKTDSNGLCEFDISEVLNAAAKKRGFAKFTNWIKHIVHPQEKKVCEAVFTVFEKDYYYTGEGCGKNEYYPICHPRTTEFTPGVKGSVLSDLVVDFHQYQTDFPALLQSKDKALFPKWKFTCNAAGKAISASMRKLWASVLSIADQKHSVKHIQEAFPTDYSDREATDEDVIQFLVNEFPVNFRNGKTADTLRVRMNFDKYDKRTDPEVPQLTNGTLTMGYKDGAFSILSVKVRLESGEYKVFMNGDEGYREALRLFLCAVQVDKQITDHLGIGHFVTEQIAMAVFGCLSDTNPIKQFLIPHLKGVFAINIAGEDFIFGRNGVLATSAYTPVGIKQRARDKIGSVNWSTDLPPGVMNQGHSFARLAQIYWEAWLQAATIHEDENEAEILAHEAELDLMSEVLVKTSPAFYPLDGKEDTNIWFDKNGVSGRHDSWRVEIDGELKSAPPITDSLFTPGNQPKNIPTRRERRIRMKAYAGYVATFLHDHLHDAEIRTSSSLKLAVLAPNNDAADPYNGVKPEPAAAQLSLVHILTNLKTTLLKQNPHNDIKSNINQILSAKFEEMKDPEKFPDTPENRALLALFEEHLDKGRLGTDA